MADAGWSSVYVPSAVVTHSGGTPRSGFRSGMLREHHRSLYRYLSRRYSSPAQAPLRALLGIGLLVRYLLARHVPSIAAGAEPTRSADVLEDGA
jgi:N-acetylglucosaminyl-diphospho-decaprenol L-rhamnosyltransferase